MQEKPRILVLNKIDLMNNVIENMNKSVINKSDAAKHNAVFISATTGEGFDNLTQRICKSLEGESNHKVFTK